jgi:hypothetical protein
MKALLISILLFIILIFISKNRKESFEPNKTNQLDEIIKYINNAINSRKNAGKNSKFYDDKYKKQILPLMNAMNYASYIQKNII